MAKMIKMVKNGQKLPKQSKWSKMATIRPKLSKMTKMVKNGQKLQK